MSQPLDLDMVLAGIFPWPADPGSLVWRVPGGRAGDRPIRSGFWSACLLHDPDDTTGYMVARVHHSRIIRFIGRELPWLDTGDGNLLGRIGAGGHLQRDCSPRQCGGKYRRADLPANVNYMETEGLDQLLGTRKHRNAAPVLECTGGAIHYGEQFRHPSYQQR